MTPSATVVYVAYGIDQLDLDWLPADTPIVVVHNDGRLGDDDARAEHLHPGGNVGFGAAVNAAARTATTERLVLVNPDAALTATHLAALREARPHEVVTVPLLDDEGRPGAPVERYPTAIGLLLAALRVGRLLPRGSTRRAAVRRLAGRTGRQRDDALAQQPGTWPLAERWASGAALSLDRERFLAVGGFDPGFFLYFEDVDLCRRLAARFGDMVVRLVDAPPGRHTIGATWSATSKRHHRRSARRYAATQHGATWRVAGAVLALLP